MTKKFLITTDSTSDLPKKYLDLHQINCLYLPCTIGETVYSQENELSPGELFHKMSLTDNFATSQFNPDKATQIWEPLLKAGYDILHISISARLSGSYNSCRIAACDLQERYPKRQIAIIDTLCTSVGEGIFVERAVEMQAQGKTLSQIALWITEHRPYSCLLIAVDDLSYFNRGGRVTDSVGSIKPIVHNTPEGNLGVAKKVRGHKRSITTIMDMMEERVINYPEERKKFLVVHGDCEEEARQVAEQIKERLDYEEYLLFPMRMTNCIHTGTGAIGLGFMGTFK
jgi:DegV family protein with EDD domain